MPNASADLVLAANVLLFAFNALLGLTGLFGPIISLVSEIQASVKKTALTRKFAQQTSWGACLAAIYVAFATVGMSLLTSGGGLASADALNLDTRTIAALAAPGAVWLIFLIAYSQSWKKMKEARGLHMLLGVVAALAGILTAASALMFLYLVIQPALAAPGQAEASAVLAQLVRSGGFLFAMACLVAAGPACAAPVLLLFVLYRRNRDDWGRDYYAKAFKRGAVWGLLFTLLSLAVIGAMAGVYPDLLAPVVAVPRLGIPWAVGLASGLGACLIWILTARSQTPLRLKWAVFLAAFLTWIMVGAFLFGGLKLSFLVY